MQDQIDMGPRLPGTNASLNFLTWVQSNVDTSDWNIEVQEFEYNGVILRNIWITGANNTEFPQFIIGAHYDSRLVADKEPSESPVPGANDGASGVAGILEMIRILPKEFIPNIGFLLFDGEDQGGLVYNESDGNIWDWIVGSTYFVDQMTQNEIDAVSAFILFDMIGDDDFSLPYERYSNTDLINQIWDQADQLGYGSIFIKSAGPSLIDDHWPFLNVGIPSIDIIDFTYPEHHTTLDDMDHISEESVAMVVDVVLYWFVGDVDPVPITTTFTPTGSFTTSTIPNRSTKDSSTLNISSYHLLLLIITYKFLRLKKQNN